MYQRSLSSDSPLLLLSSPVQSRNLKRRRTPQGKEDERHTKEVRTITSPVSPGSPDDSHSCATYEPISSWLDECQELSLPMSDSISADSKRRKRTESGSQSRSSSHSGRQERLSTLEKSGVFLANNASVYDETHNGAVCDSLFSGSRQPSFYLSSNTQNLNKIIQRAATYNETRVQRDILPWLVPSPFLLGLADPRIPSYLNEELSTDWVKCQKLFGDTLPRPDFVVGFGAGAFTEDEQKRLRSYTTYECPTLFSAVTYFPFLVCEVKLSDMADGHRQALHAGSIACDSIVQLLKTAYASQPESYLALNGRILGFSLVHNSSMAELWGHYPELSAASPEVKYWRKVIKAVVFETEGVAGIATICNAVYQLYAEFAPERRKLLQNAIALLPTYEAEAESSFGTGSLTLTAGGSESIMETGQSQKLMQYFLKQLEKQQQEDRAEYDRRQKEERSAAELSRIAAELSHQKEREEAERVRLKEREEAERVRLKEREEAERVRLEEREKAEKMDLEHRAELSKLREELRTQQKHFADIASRISAKK